MATSNKREDMSEAVNAFVDVIVDNYAAFILAGTWSDDELVRDALKRVNNLANGLVREYDRNCKSETMRVYKPRGRQASTPNLSERDSVLARLGIS